MPPQIGGIYIRSTPACESLAFEESQGHLTDVSAGKEWQLQHMFLIFGSSLGQPKIGVDVYDIMMQPLANSLKFSN